MSRGTSSKLDAVFSMPGLEEIAAPLQRFGLHPDDAVALLAYVAARPVLRSANALDDELSDPDVWSRLTRVADSVGRSLPEAPPTFDKLRHLRDKIGDDIGEVLLEMERAFTLEAFKLARLAGLAVPRDDWDLTTPIRANTLFADGTWWEPQSRVTIDPDTGEPLRSRTTGVRRSGLPHDPVTSDLWCREAPLEGCSPCPSPIPVSSART